MGMPGRFTNGMDLRGDDAAFYRITSISSYTVFCKQEMEHYVLSINDTDGRTSKSVDHTWTVGALRILRVDRNRITRLPGSLSSLRELAILDVSHNRLEAVPPALADLAARLYRCSLLAHIAAVRRVNVRNNI